MKAEDKRIINGKTDLNQIKPFGHPWAWDKYRIENSNHWLPQDIQMTTDIGQWKDPNGFTPQERLVIERNLGFFVTADSLASNNIVLGTYRHITSPEARLFLLRQAYTEVVHTEAYTYIVESLGLDEDKIFNAYINVPCIKDKDEFLIPFINRLCDPFFKTGTPEDDQKFFESLFVFACIMEGLFFTIGFVQILALGRVNKLPGASQQYQYIMRDEGNHCNFGIDMMNQIKIEQSEIWTAGLQSNLISLMDIGVYLECQYAIETMPTGFLGMNADMYCQYVKFMANRRLNQVGLYSKYKGVENPFPWMSEMMDLSKEANFFERKPIAYQSSSSLVW